MLPKEVLGEIFDLMVEKYGAKYHYKPDTLMSTGTGRIFVSTFLNLAGGHISYEDFMNNYSTTIRNNIYFCFKPSDDKYSIDTKLKILSHELTHVEQYNRDGLAFMTKYLGDGFGRAKYEAEAFSVNIEYDLYKWYNSDKNIRLFDIDSRIEQAGDKLYNYGCNKEQVDYAKGIMYSLLEISVQVIPLGRLFSPVLNDLFRILDKYAW